MKDFIESLKQIIQTSMSDVDAIKLEILIKSINKNLDKCDKTDIDLHMIPSPIYIDYFIEENTYSQDLIYPMKSEQLALDKIMIIDFLKEIDEVLKEFIKLKNDSAYRAIKLLSNEEFFNKIDIYTCGTVEDCIRSKVIKRFSNRRTLR